MPIKRKTNTDKLETNDTKQTTPVNDQVSTNNVEKTTDVIAYKTAQAAKLSLRSTGLLTYQLGFVETVQQLFVRIQSNETGGYFSKEWVPLDAVITCLEANVKSKEPFTAATLKTSFVSKSQNNAGFLAAILKAEGLLVGIVGKTNLLSFDKEHYDKWVADNIQQATNSTASSVESKTVQTLTKKKTLSKTTAKKNADKKPTTATSSSEEDDAVIEQLTK